MALVDRDAVAAAMRDVARAEVLPRFRRLGEGEIARKGDGSVVTVADLAAERALALRLRALLPGSSVIGEEACQEEPALLGLLRGDAPVWVIDPIDGTAQFAQGDPRFGMMVSLCRAGEIEQVWIHAPADDLMLDAVRGGGARRNGAPLRPARPDGLVGRYNTRRLAEEVQARFEERIRAHDLSYDVNSSHEFRRLAEGGASVYVSSWVTPWDTAPGVLMHREAGGHVAFLEDGAPYRPWSTGGTLLYAAGPAEWEAAAAALFGELRGPTRPTLDAF